MRYYVILVAFALSACAGSPARITSMSADELKAEDSKKLCSAYAFSHTENVKNELLRRNAIASSEWKIVEEKKIQPGMSELALICSRGQPGIMVKEGENQRWLYRRPNAVVFISGGKVTHAQ
jgi:hypothetical protein